MKALLLNKIRLSWYFVFFFVTFFIVCIIVPEVTISTGALTLFSVNTLLYAFYIAPLLSQQKARIDMLRLVTRSEANSLFTISLKIKTLHDDYRQSLDSLLQNYLAKLIHTRSKTSGEKEYEQIINYLLPIIEVSGDKALGNILDEIILNEKNRTNRAMLLESVVYRNEWLIMGILLFVTLIFIIVIDNNSSIVFDLLAALLATCVTMLLVILVKLSTLTHKKANQIWEPYRKLYKSKFYRID